MKTVVIAEKPSVAKAIASAYTNNPKRASNYYDVGNNTFITYCYGHMLVLKQPVDINPEYKKWCLSHLPYKEILKPNFMISKDSKDQLKAIIELLKDADMVIHAGDPDDEGQRLVDAVIEYSKTKAPVKRLLMNDNNVEVVKKALNNLKDNKEFYNLSQKALARSMADLIFGTNLTVAYSKKYNESIFIGRVSTAILSLVVQRTNSNKNHVAIPYYDIENIFEISGEKIKAKLISNIGAPMDEENRFINKQFLKKFQEKMAGKSCVIKNIEVKEKEQQPPLLFNLLKLQIEASKIYDYSANETLKITQNLREKHGLITYNRSDSQYLNEEHHADAPIVLEAIKSNLDSLTGVINTHVDALRKSRVFDNKKVTAHHGIIPTLKKVDITQLTLKEKNIYELIAKRYVAQFLPLRKTEQTIISLNSDGIDFISSGTIEVDEGWKIIVEDEKNIDDSESIFNKVFKEGEEGIIDEIKIIDKKTKPLPLYTLPSLLSDLTQVSKYVKNLQLKKVLIDKDKGKEGEKGGIGTPATRSSILELLFNRNYLVYDNKNIIPNSEAVKIFDVLSDDIKYPDLTARWQIQLNDIEEGNLNLNDFISQIHEDVINQINLVKSDDRTINDTYPCSCGGSLRRIKKSDGTTFWGCSNYKSCDMKYEEENDKPVPVKTYPCSCGGSLRRIKKSDGTTFWGCSNYKSCDMKYEEENDKPVPVVRE